MCLGKHERNKQLANLNWAQNPERWAQNPERWGKAAKIYLLSPNVYLKNMKQLGLLAW